MTAQAELALHRRWLTWIGGSIGVALLALLFWRIDWRLFADTVATARLEYVVAIFLAIVCGQLLRAWKWGQILRPIRRIATWRLFEAIMAGYLANHVVPLGLSPFVRSWLVARQSGLRMSAVLATVAVDRLIDGLVFAALVLVIVAVAVIPDSGGTIRLGLAASAIASATLIAGILVLLWRNRHQTTSGTGPVLRLVARLPERIGERLRAIAVAFAEGTVWPNEPWRRGLIVLLSLVSKLVAASHLFFAGLAFGVDLSPMIYLVLLAILGFVVVLAHLVRIPAGFVLGGVFALGLFGVDQEKALAMVTLVMAASFAAVVLFGMLGLWRQGLTLGDLSAREIGTDAAR